MPFCFFFFFFFFFIEKFPLSGNKKITETKNKTALQEKFNENNTASHFFPNFNTATCKRMQFLCYTPCVIFWLLAVARHVNS